MPGRMNVGYSNNKDVEEILRLEAGSSVTSKSRGLATLMGLVLSINTGFTM